MQIEAKEVFAVEIEGDFFYFQCMPAGHQLHKDDIILNGDEERSDVYICEECGYQIG